MSELQTDIIGASTKNYEFERSEVTFFENLVNAIISKPITLKVGDEHFLAWNHSFRTSVKCFLSLKLFFQFSWTLIFIY